MPYDYIQNKNINERIKKKLSVKSTSNENKNLQLIINRTIQI